MLEGIRYVRGRPDLVMVLALVFFVGTFGMNFQITTALMATEVFGKGAGEFGVLGSIMAIGSLTGALLAASRGRPRLRLLLGAAVAFGVVEVVAGLMPTYATFALALIPVGVTSLTFITAANATMQLAVDPVMRGRVMALYMAVFMGGTPIGAPLVGRARRGVRRPVEPAGRRDRVGDRGGRLRRGPVAPAQRHRAARRAPRPRPATMPDSASAPEDVRGGVCPVSMPGVPG